MEHCRAAERALVTGLVLGLVDPAELSARLRRSDFTDPAAGVLFEVAVTLKPGDGGLGEELPRLLQRRGLLRADGYPITQLLEWLPQLPVPVNPEAWATLVVAGSLGRQVHASGVRLLQCADGVQEHGYAAGRVLAMAEAQRAALVSAARRWEALPQRWRATLPADGWTPAPVTTSGVRCGDGEGAARERPLLEGLVAAPQLLGRLPWLREEDFTDPACGALFATVRRLHEFGHPVDVVTLAAAVAVAVAQTPQGQDGETPAAVAGALRPDRAFPTSVPFLARQVLEHAVVAAARAVGEDLVRLGGTQGPAVGPGLPLLTAARARLESLRPHQLRLEHATADAHPRVAAPRSLAPSRALPTGDRSRASLDRHAG